jgi:hypothetical protein
VVIDFKPPVTAGTNEKRLAYYARCMRKLVEKKNEIHAVMLARRASQDEIKAFNRGQGPTRRVLIEKMAKLEKYNPGETDDERAAWLDTAREDSKYDAAIDVSTITEAKPSGEALAGGEIERG